MRAVLDTNVLISGVISTGVSHKVLVSGFTGEYRLLISIDILDEFRDTLAKYPGKFHLTLDDIQQEVNTIRYYATFVIPDEQIVEIKTDPSDNMFLEAAVAGAADYIVSGDPHLLNLDNFRGIDIMNPTDFLEILQGAVNEERVTSRRSTG